MSDQATRLRQLVGTSQGPAERKEYVAPPHSEQSLAGGTGARVMAITSGKGGVGKTNLAVNLAIAFKEAGQRVLLIDADLGMANVDVVLGSVSKKHLLNLLEAGTELSDVMVHGPYGIDYISGGSGIEKAAGFSYEERQLLQQKLAGCGQLADIIIIDTGAGLGKNVMDFILAADEVLLVTTPEPTALTDAYAVMKAYSMYASLPNLKLVVNRVYDEQESREVVAKLQQTSERFLHMPLECLGYIFEDVGVTRAVRRQQPFMAMSPSGVASRCVKGLAASVLYGSKMTVKRGWKGFLQQIFNFSH